MKKYIAELIGTFVLVFFGCGTAVVLGGLAGGVAGSTLGAVGIALAFGLSIVATAYVIGPVSGCHINPAVSLAMLILKRMNAKDFVGYVVAQILGALAASGIMKWITLNTEALRDTASLGQNGFGAESAVGLSMGGAIVVEIILTFVFILAVVGVTASVKNANVAGIVIGLTLAFVHIMGIPLTGTSVNPARSLAPALFMGGTALSQVWLFLVMPLVGAALAALVYKAVLAVKEDAQKEA